MNIFAIFVNTMLLAASAYAFSIGNFYLGAGLSLIVLILIILLLTEML